MSTLQILDMEQRSEAWYAARCGIVTASVVGKLVTPKTIKPAANDDSRALITHLAAERITGIVEETWTSRDMERGILAEPFARDLYSKHYGKAVECGFMVRNFGQRTPDRPEFVIGYSPDGVVGDDGLIEIKAPRPKAHVSTVVAGEVPPEYMAQMQTGLLVSGRAWCDFVPYVSGLPLWRKRIEPDARWFVAIKDAVEQAEEAIRDVVAKYEQAVEGCPATERIDFFEEVVI